MATTYKIIDKTTLGSSQAYVEFTGLGSYSSDYTDLLIKVAGRSTTNLGGDWNGCSVQFNGSTSSYSSKQLYGYGSGTGSASSASDNFWIPSNLCTSDTFGNAEIYIPNFSSSNYKSFSADSVNENNATSNLVAITASLWSNIAAITSIKISDAANSFASGSSFYLYGIKNS